MMMTEQQLQAAKAVYRGAMSVRQQDRFDSLSEWDQELFIRWTIEDGEMQFNDNGQPVLVAS